jgi:PAS domain S-box-containing protein
MRAALAAALLIAAAPPALETCAEGGGRKRHAPESEEGAKPPFTSYREIPGVTEGEAAAIAALQNKYKDSVLVYGILESIESFVGQSGEVTGFAAHVCAYMSTLFGLSIKPALLEWGGLISGLESGAVLFSGDPAPTEKRKAVYHMTSAITNRAIVYYRLEGSEPISKIAAERPLRYGFFEGASTPEAIHQLSQDVFESAFATEFSDANEMLKSGKIDAFFEEYPAKPVFDAFGGITTNMFLPLIYEPVSLCTQLSDFMPIISVMDKFLSNGGLNYFVKLYNVGLGEYSKHKMLSMLTDEEKAYIKSNPTVAYAAEYDSYPSSFYNANEKQWQGISLDILREIEALTGITFKIANSEHAAFSELIAMLERGEVSLITDLVRTKERLGRFLWPQTTILLNRYALISKAGHRNIGISEVPNTSVGVQTGTANEELFKMWFPGHANALEYKSANDLYDALDRGDIDMAMSSQNEALAVTNYLERPGYKVNILFDHIAESSFGFNKDERVLCSIIDKALGEIELARITDLWLHKTYDYRVKIVQSRQPFLISISVLLMCVVGLMFVLLRKTRSTEKRLEALVAERTVKLQDQNKFMEAVTKNYKGVIWSVAGDGCITMFSGQYLKTIGIESSFLVGKNLDIARQKNRHLDIISNVQKTFSEGPQDWMSVLDGRTFHTNTMPIYDADGKVVGVTGTTDDITEMVKLSQDLEAALEAAKSANRAKSAFLANMSHEIRTPMNSIVGFSELALDYDLPEEPAEYLCKIMENSTWLLQIINDILDVSKIEAGKMTLENIPFDLHEMFALCRTATMPKAMEKGLLLHFYAEPFIGKRLIGDQTRLRQVFINLISNAVKFTNIGTVKVSATILSTGEEAITMHFEVKDSGIGMTPEEMEKVLEPFAQADYSTTRKYGGTGLGLSIIKSIVDLMGGELYVESTPGIGSKFSFDLKFQTIDISEDDGDAPGLSLNDIEKPAFEGEVLACEDNSMNQEVIRKHLERVGLRLAVADNGKAGVDIVRNRAENGERPFDLIFMDINMPIMDGLEAAAQILGMGVKTPIVAMTANVMTNEKELYEKSGMHDCVGKPFTSQELWRCLLKYLKPTNKPTSGDAPQIYDNDLLLEMRTIFVNDNQHKFKEFQGALSGGDIQKAHRIAHTLKSNAGTIGKPALQAAAADAEFFLKDGKNALAPKHVSALEKELSAALEELEPLRAKERGNPQGASAKTAPLSSAAENEPIEWMNELASQLQRGSPNCMKHKDALRKIQGAEKLIKQMDDFDFDDAFKTFSAIREKMERRNG